MIGSSKGCICLPRLVAVTSLLWLAVSVSLAEDRGTQSRPALNQSTGPQSMSTQSAQDVMAAALRDLDLAAQTYQARVNFAPSVTGGSQPLDTPPFTLSAPQAEWEALLLTRDHRVQAWQDYFSGPAGPRLLAAFDHLIPFRQRVAEVLGQTGLPHDLIAVAFAESGLNSCAVSPKGAAGAWQLMPATAARYGLERGAETDERTNFEKSTVAAARYLADLYQLFGDWALVLAAYNAGEERVLGAIVKGKTRDFWRLSQQGLLPEETQEYVPKVLGTARAWKTILPDLAGLDQPGMTFSGSAGGPQTWTYALGPGGEIGSAAPPIELGSVVTTASLTRAQASQPVAPYRGAARPRLVSPAGK